MGFKTVTLPYGEAGLSSFRIPSQNYLRSYRPKPHPVVTDVGEAVLKAVAAPIGTRPLRDLLAASSARTLRVSIIVDDLTRGTPVATVLPPMLTLLSESGVAEEHITITVALGTHRPMTESELRVRVGAKVFATYRVENSHFYDPSQMVLVGHANEDVPIYIDRTVADSDFRIGIGSIVPHGAVGWSGGGKILYPGVAGQETVKRFHFMHGLTKENMKGRRDCVVRTTMEEWVERIGLDFVCNTVLDQNGDVARVVAGHYVDAQREGVRTAEKIYLYSDETAADITVSVSHPHDGDFWQAAKGIFSAEQLTRFGGHIVLVAPCHEGEGNHLRFIERSGDDGVHQLLRAILHGEASEPDDVISIAPACLLNQISKRHQIHVVSPNLDPKRVQRGGFLWSASVQETVDRLLSENPNHRVATVLHSDLSFAGINRSSEGSYE
jgi:lactate racemase